MCWGLRLFAASACLMALIARCRAKTLTRAHACVELGLLYAVDSHDHCSSGMVGVRACKGLASACRLAFCATIVSRRELCFSQLTQRVFDCCLFGRGAGERGTSIAEGRVGLPPPPKVASP